MNILTALVLRRSISYSSKMLNMENFVPGPLDFYRKKASFDWKKLKLFLESEDIVTFQNDIYKELQKHPDFNVDFSSSRNLDETRRLIARQAMTYKYVELFRPENILIDIKRPAALLRILMQYCPALVIKFNVTNILYTSTIMNMGTDRHIQYIIDNEEGKAFGCYCLTEISHGSNTRGMRTTATYDEEKKHFILNSPDFEAAKCWVGGLGQLATNAVVYAQLVLKNVNYGLHAFVVPIRDLKTLAPYPGLIVGDMGEKIGLNGIDNGFVAFNNYQIPRENLLNKVADVSEDGQYITSIKDPNRRHGATLGALSAGRVTIGCMCEALGFKALTIAIRYAAVRRQFGPGSEEVPVLEYQSHQHRLLPYLAAAYVLRIFNNYFSETFHQFAMDTITGQNKKKLPDLGMEIHAISSASKSVAGWTLRDAVQECRETCGGHGYLKASGIGDVKNDYDANLTYEGENHILIQQTGNWLLKMWPLILQNKQISTPLQSINFLTNCSDILRKKFTVTTIEELCVPENIIAIYQWLTCHLLKVSYNKVEKELKSGKEIFEAKNDSQVYYLKTLAIVFVQHFFLQQNLIFITKAEDPAIKDVLTKLFLLYGLWALEKHIPILYQGEFAQGPNAVYLIQDSILKLCADLKNDAVSLIDAVAVPDFIINSALGASDGMVYKNLQSSIFRSPYTFSRPTWWQEIVKWKPNKL